MSDDGKTKFPPSSSRNAFQPIFQRLLTRDILKTSARGRASSLASNPPASRTGSTDSRRHPVSSTPVTEKSLKPAPVSVKPPALDDGISGKPFHSVEDAKAEATLETAPTPAGSVSMAVGCDTKENDKIQGDRPPTRCKTDSEETALNEKRTIDVPVGISRLHMTSLPALQMKPLYWSPVNDIAIVTRATWFYR